mmetsp:Transcript_3810/g.14150  ORF Transcript_3810/g.14150 Transcript_3810/m.14150 type:complete len:203 (-) Transcript_3810:3256-3864(-)
MNNVGRIACNHRHFVVQESRQHEGSQDFRLVCACARPHAAEGQSPDVLHWHLQRNRHRECPAVDACRHAPALVAQDTDLPHRRVGAEIAAHARERVVLRPLCGQRQREPGVQVHDVGGRGDDMGEALRKLYEHRSEGDKLAGRQGAFQLHPESDVRLRARSAEGPGHGWLLHAQQERLHWYCLNHHVGVHNHAVRRRLCVFQ